MTDGMKCSMATQMDFRLRTVLVYRLSALRQWKGSLSSFSARKGGPPSQRQRGLLSQCTAHMSWHCSCRMAGDRSCELPLVWEGRLESEGKA